MTDQEDFLARFLPSQEARDLFERILHDAVIGAIADGDIDPSQLDDEQLLASIADFMQRFRLSERWVVDRRRPILSQARAARRDGELELSCLLYATWCEHWLNGLVASLARRRNLKDFTVRDLIREVSLRGKATWVLELLGARRLAGTHVKAITRLSEARNEFVHYKWKPFDPNTTDPVQERVKAAIQKFEHSVRYLQSYKTRHLLTGASRRVMRLIRSATRGL